jgi:hypothetical protein
MGGAGGVVGALLRCDRMAFLTNEIMMLYSFDES